MSNNANSNRDDDKFFPPETEDEKPKAPGSFTQSFMSAGADTSASAAFDSAPPKSPSPFTAQFGSTDAFAPIRDVVHSGSVPEPLDRGTQPSTGLAGSFTTMFESNTPAESQPSESPTEVTRVFDRSATTVPPPRESKPSGFTEMFGTQGAAASAPEPPSLPSVVSPFETRTAGVKTPEFTELFKPQTPVAQSTLAAQVPLSPLSAQPGTGRFTELFKTQPAPTAVKATAAPTPFSSSGASGFTDLFKAPSIPSPPATPTEITPPPTGSAPGGFTQLFKGSVVPAQPSPLSPKPAGEFTQMISGDGLTSRPPSVNPVAASQAGATRLFSGESIAPAMAPLPAGPSEYTRVVSAHQLRDLQQAPPVSNPAAPAPTGQLAAPGVPQIPAWPTAPTPVMPGVSPARVPQLGTIPSPQPWQAPQVPVFPPAPAIPTTAPKTESKLLTYLPIIIGLNVLFLIAVLLILLFALRR